MSSCTPRWPSTFKRVHVGDPGSASRAHGQSSDKLRSGLPGLLAIALAICHWCVHRYMCHARTCPLIQKIAFSVGNGRRSRATAFTCQFQVLPAGVKSAWRSGARADEETRRSDEVHTGTYTVQRCDGDRGGRRPSESGRHGFSAISAMSIEQRTCHRMRAMTCTEKG